ncbi:MAG TPA: hypothetical protein VN854_00415, partial [Mycoplasmatales bacterium]|nr:hypothetical protein [Mycoplasmatales bacterium]
MVKPKGSWKSYAIWQSYDDFIKDLYLVNEKEQKKIKWEYLSKVVVIAFASFFTTFSFQFLMEPNG